MASGLRLFDLLETPLPLGKDRRMDETVEDIPFLPIREDDCAQFAAVDPPVRKEDPFSEMADDLPPHRPLRLFDRMGQVVEVDEDGPFLHQHPGDGRFTAGNPACQAHIQHLFPRNKGGEGLRLTPHIF